MGAVERWDILDLTYPDLHQFLSYHKCIVFLFENLLNILFIQDLFKEGENVYC